MQTEPAFSLTRVVPAARAGRRPVWPAVLVAFGLVLTLLWASVLGYGLIRLIEMTYLNAG
jgi:hypothetical protein